MSKPLAIIVDVDGTLALRGDRSPYDWSKVGLDTVNEPIADIVRAYDLRSVFVLVVSGRDGSCVNATGAWLRRYDIPFDRLFMRPAGNTEKDSIIKKRIFDDMIRDKFDVLFVLDDRNQVVEMWRSLGLVCLQVAPGNF